MSETRFQCECGRWIEESAENAEEWKCPGCGKSIRPEGRRPGTMRELLSDSAVEATCEVMAEEGAIWSGAR
ncbi:MAG: hypothetical protein JXL84_08625 [Deltaproteobacteria bacterium]|nr:hypothetical protein [Deltaproteobacteria bacterium]